VLVYIEVGRGRCSDWSGVIERKSDRGVTAKWLVGLKFNPKPDQLKQVIVPLLWRKCSNSNKNSL
jgi:hypothetical protein